MPNRLDRLLVAGLALLVIAAGADALRHRIGSSHAAGPAPTRAAGSLPRAPVPERIRLVPSTTAFLPRCENAAIRLTVGPGPEVTLRYAGRPCHVPPLHLRLVVRTRDGQVAYAGPALAYEDLSGNYAGEGVAHGRLLGACEPGAATARVSGSGLSATGSVRCATGP
jgi:hypothetical protein